MDVKWSKTDNWSEYETILGDGTTITVAKFFPGEMWWADQNFYWAWRIDYMLDNGHGPRLYQAFPGGEYQRTMADCKRDALSAAERVAR